MTYMTIRQAFLVPFVALSLMACAPAQGPQTSSGAAAPAPAAVSAGPVISAPRAVDGRYAVFEVNGVKIPLPEGEWRRLGEADLTTARNYPASAVVVASETGGAIDRVVVVWRQRVLGGRRFGAFKNCGASSNLTSDTRSSAPASTDCVFVRTANWPSSGRLGPMLRKHANARGIFAPVVTVGPRVALSLSARERIAVDYAFNPDLLAPHPDGEVWLPGDWTPSAARGGARDAVVEALRDFGLAIRPQVAAAAKGSS